MIWGYPYLREPPYVYIYIYTVWSFNVAMENHHFVIGRSWKKHLYIGYFPWLSAKTRGCIVYNYTIYIYIYTSMYTCWWLEHLFPTDSWWMFLREIERDIPQICVYIHDYYHVYILQICIYTQQVTILYFFCC